jgi:hypothetical protein
VILEVGVLAEPSVADVALEGPGPIVNIHVRFEVPGCRERLGAQATFMGLLLDMSHAVIIQVGAGGEPFAAHLTLVRFLPAVDAPMCV